MTQLRDVLLENEPWLETSLSESMMSAWLTAAADVVTDIEAPEVLPEALPDALPEVLPAEEELLIDLPQVRAAANDLASRQVLSRDAYDMLDMRARQKAFTVARLTTDDALRAVQAILVDDIEQGGTLRDFASRVDESLGAGVLSPSHLENVYRTNVGQAYATGQREILAHPLVADEFPYVAYSATHDDRTEPNHLMMEKLGIQGTNIYRADDPVIRKFWPPWRWQCRCDATHLSVEDAAEAGIREAQEWLASGKPPRTPAHVPHPPFDLPKGWASSGSMTFALN